MPNYSGIWTEQAMMQAVAAGTWSSVPGAPTIGTATATGATSASVAFTAPGFAGIPATITSYTVTSSPGNITATGTSSPIAITGLTEGTPYTFTVTATNASGTGTASAASNSVTPVQINYIEEMFQTWLYTGNGSTQTITNGIDLAGKGGLVWVKQRDGTYPHVLSDSAQGFQKGLVSNSSAATDAVTNGVTYSTGSVTSTGLILGANTEGNASGSTFVSWTFRKQPKFFDVVTYTGNGTAGRTVAHSLGSVPGMMIVKRTDASGQWAVYHRSTSGTPQNDYLLLNQTAGAYINQDLIWNNTAPTSTVFTVGSNSAVNANGGTYVAYLFAHNAGGFGTSGSDNVISCGAFTSNSDGSASVTLGYEPQFLLYKRTDSTGDWILLDTMRGFSQTSGAMLRPNTSGAEQVVSGDLWNPTATGFIGEPGTFGVSTQNIYIAIRRGPMKVPTTGTSVFSPNTTTATTGTKVTTDFPVDFQITRNGSRTDTTSNVEVDRLRGVSSTATDGGPFLATTSTNGEQTSIGFSRFWDNTGFQICTQNGSGISQIYWNFRRAPGFFDEVCYTGTGSNPNTLNHNLGVIPEFVIYRRRNSTGDWETGVRRNDGVYSQQSLNSTGAAYGTLANAAAAGLTATTINPPAFGSGVNVSGGTYVAYLFASCPGVSSVGSYTGTGATQVINCGFAAGARFVLVKATSTTGNWLVYDTARGMIPSNDPYLALNSTAAEVTGTDWVDTAATGFELSNNAGNLANSNGVSYIFLAIA